MTVEWNFYDPEAAAIKSRRNRPHIDMAGVLTFLTFRLADSMPKKVVLQWHNEIEQWLSDNDLAGWTVKQVLNSADVEEQLKAEVRQFKNRRWHNHLDDCHGSCLLKHSDVRSFVHKNLLNFHGQRYDLERFVIMPNHVHLLVQMRTGYLLRTQFRETLRFTARQINAHLGRTGPFWQTEPFDHLVRSESQFQYLQKYIDENPNKANLRAEEYELWVC